MGKKINIAFVIVVAFLLQKYFNPTIILSPIVETSNGKLQGKISTSRDGRNYFEFVGVRYARPPVGELRYEPPEPLTEKWKGVKDATSVGPICLQVDGFRKFVAGDEDCLLVNIASPKLGTHHQLPVLVFFHGGIFNFGSGSEYKADYLMDEDVVLVTVGYRLSSFGFLNTGDSLIRGNMGLKDQNMALQYVKQNIEQFGGNPNDVTISGESAGGASVDLQIISPMSKGLFHKAIAQSGLSTMPWGILPDPAAQAKRFALQNNCPTSNTKDMVKCLKSKNASDLVEIHKETTDSLRPMIALYLPTIEKDLKDGKSFLTDLPKTIIESGKYNKVPLLAGVNSAEGLLISGPVIANKTLALALHQDWSKTLPLLMLTPNKVEAEITEKIKSYYFNGKFNHENPMSQMLNFTNLFSDWIFYLGFQNGISSHLKQTALSAPIYLYYYNYNGDFNLSDLLLSLKGDYHQIIELVWMKVSTWFKTTILGQTRPDLGSCHGDELALEYPLANLVYVSKNDKDYEFSKKFIKLLIQFIKSDSSKRPALEFSGQKWMPQEPNKPLSLMKLDLTPKMISEPYKERLAFWHSIGH